MGIRASARLWYGVRGEIHEAARTELEEPTDNQYGEKIVDGVRVHMVYEYDRPIGAGATLAHGYWGDECVVNLDDLPRVKAAADKFLDEYNVAGERHLNLTADFS